MGIADELKQANKSRASLAQEQEQQKVTRLRSLLLGTEYNDALSDLIKESDKDRVTKVITEAISERSHKDQSLGTVLSPIIDSAIDESIKQNPKRITNVIFPVMGPAIRKAVSAALSDMVQSLNEILSNSLSVKSWAWRYQAWRAGKSYGEFVLLKTLKYRVEQVFLIHKETGLLLCDVSSPTIEKQDPELVSSMLTAINDFVQDSFHKAEQLSVDSIRFGEYTLSIMPGPLAVIAAAVKGSPTQELNPILRASVESIHEEHLNALIEFEGDKADFLITEPTLKSCLIAKELPQEKSIPWRAYVVLVILFIVGMSQVLITASALNQKQNIIEAFKQQPGYVVIDQSTENDTLNIDLLRSPNSLPPLTIISSFSDGQWKINLQEKIAPLELSEFLIPYIRELFILPATTILSTSKSGDLVISGSISEDSLIALRDNSLIDAAFAGVITNDVTIEPSKSAKQFAIEEWQNLSNKIQSTRIYFESNSNTLQAGENLKFPELIRQLKKLNELSKLIEIKEYQVLITGFADFTGGSRVNSEISRSRAELVSKTLIDNGLSTNTFVTWGAGYIDTNNLPAQEQRIVSLQVLQPKLDSYIK